MPLRDDILKPIPGDKPGGQDLRYAPIYDKIKEARREDDDLNQGAWQHERKVADHNTVIKLAQEAIATQSKDLQLAAWLTGSLLKTKNIPGLIDGLNLCKGIVDTFWDTLFPELEDGDAELRTAPLDWIGSRLDVDVKKVGLTRDGYTFFQYKDSRGIIPEDQAKTKEQKASRDIAIKEGKIRRSCSINRSARRPKPFTWNRKKAWTLAWRSWPGSTKRVRKNLATPAPVSEN